MKTSVLSCLLLSACLFPAVRSTPARATVLWTATLEKGDLSEWTGGPNPTKTLPGGMVRKNVEVVGEQVHSGSFACKITVHPDDTYGQYNQDRVDIKHESTLTGEGKDSYLSGHYFLPADAKTRNEIAFYETKVTSRNWMDLWVEPKPGGGTTVKFGIESNGANLGSVLVWTGEWKVGQWHQFAIHVHWSTDATKGIVDLWFDGQPVVAGYKHKTKFDGNDLYYETGLHRVLPQNFVETIYFDDFIEADTEAEIKIGAPTPGGNADGAAGEAGGADTAGPGSGGMPAADGGNGATGGTGVTGSGGTTAGTGGNGGAAPTGAGGSGGSSTGTAGGPGASAGDASAGCACTTSVSVPINTSCAIAALGALAMIGRRRRHRR